MDSVVGREIEITGGNDIADRPGPDQDGPHGLRMRVSRDIDGAVAEPGDGYDPAIGEDNRRSFLDPLNLDFTTRGKNAGTGSEACRCDKKLCSTSGIYFCSEKFSGR